MLSQFLRLTIKLLYKIIRRGYRESLKIFWKLIRFIIFFFSNLIFYFSLPFLLALKNIKNKEIKKEKKLLIVRLKFGNKKKKIIASSFYFLDDIPSLNSFGFNKKPLVFTVDNLIPFLNLIRIAFKIVLNDISLLIVGCASDEISHGLNIFSFSLLSRIFKLQISSLWFDTCGKKEIIFLNKFQSNLNKRNSLMQTFALENPIYYPFQKNKFNKNFANNKVVGAFTPLNPYRWKPAKVKDIDVVFIGQVGSYRSTRKKFIQSLKKLESKYSLFISNLDRNNFISWEEYIDIMRRAKIVVNFSGSSYCHQLKGRVFEAMNCGAVVIDYIDSPISYYFEKDKHFISYRDENDLLVQLNLILSDPNKIKYISKESRSFVQKNFSPEVWWETILPQTK